MKICPYCREELQEEAIKCRYCGSSLLPGLSSGISPTLPEIDSKQVLLILDRGLIYFAKFVGAVLLVLIVLGAAFFGFDLSRAREDVHRARDDIEKTKTNIAQMTQNTQASYKEYQDKIDEAQRNLKNVQIQIDKMYKESESLLSDARAKFDQTQNQLDKINNNMRAEAEHVVKENLYQLKSNFDRVAEQFKIESDRLLQQQREDLRKVGPSSR